MNTDAPPDARLDSEERIIQDFLAPLAAGYPGAYGLKDDCAAFTPTPGNDLVVKTDPVASGVHFFEDDAPEDIGWKALAVNVSDLAAKAATPRAYLMALSFPEAPTRDWMRRFAQGLGDAQARFGMHLIGGDTDKRPGPVTISITVLGEVPSGRMVRRATARPGDLMFVSGQLGSAAMGLALRTRDRAGASGQGPSSRPVEPDDQDHEGRARVIGASLRPMPRLGLRAALLAHASAAMDLSDGLAKDLGRMCRASGCGATVSTAQLPLEDIVRAAVAATPERWVDVVASGDDYEVLAAVPPQSADAFMAQAGLDGVAVTLIGRFQDGDGVAILDPDGVALRLTRTGWDHF